MKKEDIPFVISVAIVLMIIVILGGCTIIITEGDVSNIHIGDPVIGATDVLE